MKDLCDWNTAELGDGDKVEHVRPLTEERTVAQPPKIKSFHRRNREIETVLVTEPKPVDPPATLAATHSMPAEKPEAVLEKEPTPSVSRSPLWSRVRTIKVDTDLAMRRGLPMVDRFRDTESAKAIDLLRTRMLHTLRAQGWRRVAIAAPTSGCGATWVTTNLAQGLARIPNSRTIVMDLNFRKPGVAQALALPVQGDMAGFLSGRLPGHRHLLRLTDGLAVGLNGASTAVGSEVLHNPTAAKVIDTMMEDSRADVALFDLPPVLEHDDLTAFLPQVDGVLLVADGTRTTAKDLAACEKILAGHTQLLGVVLNRARPK